MFAQAVLLDVMSWYQTAALWSLSYGAGPDFV